MTSATGPATDKEPSEADSPVIDSLVSLDSELEDDSQVPDFYWKQTRENLFTDAGLRIFQLAYSHKDEEYDIARSKIDRDYERLSPRLQKKGGGIDRHGGYFATYMGLLEEMGLMYREEKDGKVYLRATPAGDQAALILHKVPDVLRVVPYFILELLSRYRLNNPLNKNPKNARLADELARSDIFPYWSIYKIMRNAANTLTKDELARFVFRTKRMSDINTTIDKIREYRQDLATGIAPEALDTKYGAPLTGVIAQPKFIMGRAGVQVGVIEQDDDVFKLNPSYIPFIDELLAHEPHFEELDEISWVRMYGTPVGTTDTLYLPFDSAQSSEPLVSEITDDDPIFQSVKQLLKEDEFAGVILAGPPGTGKTWYARQIGIKFVEGDGSRLREVQFHPSYQYESFIEGYAPYSAGGFKLADGHLLKMCDAALRTGKTHVLIIDELSRTDPARVIGEAMTYMETSLRGQPFYLPSGRRVVIPSNLFFLATLNPEDRSVDEIDAAMDRRWAKVYLAPNPANVNGFLSTNNVPEVMRGKVLTFFTWVQAYYKLGHAFFRTVKDRPSLERLWDNHLVFLFEKAFRYDLDTLQEIRSHWSELLHSIENPANTGA